MDFLIGMAVVATILFFLMSKTMKRSKGAAEQRKVEIQELEKKITVVTTNDIPGKTISKTLGAVMGSSSHLGDLKSGVTYTELLHVDADSSESQAMLAMLKKAHEKGANAVIAVTMSTSHVGDDGSQTRVMYSGTAVVAE